MHISCMFACMSVCDVVSLQVAPYSAMWVAVEKRHFSVVIALAEAGADVNQYRDYDGITLLHIYSDAGEVEVVSALLACNASLTAKNTQGWLPIDVAATDEIIQLINDEDDRRRNHGLKRTVIPPPTTSRGL